MRRYVRLLCLGLPILLASGCGDDEASPGSGRIGVVATTTQLADLARNVAGDTATVTGLLGPNADPHDYEIRPSDLDGLAGARLVLRSGGDLDEWLDEAVRSAGGSPAVIELLDVVRTADGGEDPHWWQDPRNAMRAVTAIRDALAEADPRNAPAYRAGAKAYLEELEALDAAVAACMAKVPADARKLVTTHDALGFYARRYGIEVVGAVIPSRSTRGQPSAGEVAALVDTIRREDVKAVFAETGLDPTVEKAIAEESGATIGDALYADTLGPRGSAGETYVKSIQANTRALVEGFTRGAVTCRLGSGSGDRD